MSNTEQVEAEAIQRLDAVIGLLAELCARGDARSSVRDRILVLEQVGLPPAVIAAATGKSQKYVHAVLSKVRKQRAKRKGADNGAGLS